MGNEKNLVSIELGEWLKKLRLSTRMSATEVSTLASCSPEEISLWESGHPLSITDFLTLSKIYGVTPDLMAAKMAHVLTKHHLKKSHPPESDSK